MAKSRHTNTALAASQPAARHIQLDASFLLETLVCAHGQLGVKQSRKDNARLMPDMTLAMPECTDTTTTLLQAQHVTVTQCGTLLFS